MRTIGSTLPWIRITRTGEGDGRATVAFENANSDFVIPAELGLTELNYDSLIASQLPAIAGCLAAGGLIKDDSALLFLGTVRDTGEPNKPKRVDVLLAEASAGSGGAPGDFRRLVLVEDKLDKNPESRRRVLSQILDYAQTFQSMTFEDLRSQISEQLRPWLDEYRLEVEHCLDDGDFLLVLAGDRIHPRALELADWELSKQNRMLSKYEFAAVELSLYGIPGTKDEYLFIPHLVGAVKATERTCIKLDLTVRSQDGAELKIARPVITEVLSEDGTEEDGPSRSAPISPAAYLNNMRELFDEPRTAAVQKLLECLTRLAASSRDRFKIRYGAKPNFYWISGGGTESRIFTLTNDGRMRLFSESLIKQGMGTLAEQIRATATDKVPGIHEGGDFHQLSVDITSESVNALCSVAQYVYEVLSEERGKA
ncbi:MAG: hypothetical protein M0R80_29225 [Proteobacteria bacterium]|nr:hypothetical protein [Pseudomonadota bacterium]